MKEYNPEDYVSPMCALVRRNSQSELYVVYRGQDMFVEYINSIGGEVVIPDLGFDFVVLKANGDFGRFFAMSFAHNVEGTDETFLVHGLIQAVDGEEAGDILCRAKDTGSIEASEIIYSYAYECDGSIYPRIDSVMIGSCLLGANGVHGSFGVHSGNEGGRRIFGDGGEPCSHDFAYLFCEGCRPLQLWPSDRFLYGSEVDDGIGKQ